MRSAGSNFGMAVFYVAIIVISICVFCSGNCGAPDPKLQRALESQGMTHVHVGDWDAFECSGSDSISRSFTARNSAGQSVSGTVCCGYFIKGCTVRW